MSQPCRRSSRERRGSHSYPSFRGRRVAARPGILELGCAGARQARDSGSALRAVRNDSKLPLAARGRFRATDSDTAPSRWLAFYAHSSARFRRPANTPWRGRSAASPLVTKLWVRRRAMPASRAKPNAWRSTIADHAAVIDFCKKPADRTLSWSVRKTPLATGIVDDLTRAGIKAFGPEPTGGAARRVQGIYKRRFVLNSAFRPAPMAVFFQCCRCAGLCAPRAKARRSWSRADGLAAGKGRGGRHDHDGSGKRPIAMMFDGAFRRGRRRRW